jgi:parallel beta-helix repeat protein
VFGNTGKGIVVGVGCTILGCSVENNYSQGIYAASASVIKDCSASDNGYSGGFSGIETGALSLILNCVAGNSGNGASGNGITCGNNGTVKNCIAFHNSNGIAVPGGTIALENQCYNNIADGILATNALNRIEGNHTNFNGGIGIHAGADWVVRNTSSNNTNGNFIPAAGPDIGPIQTASTATNPFANLQ